MPKGVESDSAKKALKAGELLKSQIDSVSDEERSEVVKGIVEMLGLEVPEATKTDEGAEVEKTGEGEDGDSEVTKSDTPETPEVEKDIEESPENEVSILRSEIESLKEHTHPELSDIIERLKGLEALGEFMDAELALGKALDARLRELENLNGVSKASDTELGDEVTASVERVSEARKSVWTPPYQEG